MYLGKKLRGWPERRRLRGMKTRVSLGVERRGVARGTRSLRAAMEGGLRGGF